MTSQSRDGDSESIETRLAQLRMDLTFPDTPDIASAFARNDIPHLSGPSPARSRRMRLVPWELLAAVMILGIMAFAIPGARATLASWLDFPGIRFEVGTSEAGDQTPLASIGETLLLGRKVSIQDSAATARFDIVAPTGDRISETPETYLLQRDGTVMVSLLYPAGEALPEIGRTGVGLLLMQIDSPESTAIFTKRSMNEQSPLAVQINGAQGSWIEGGTLTVEPVYESGTFERSSGNVLIWEHGGVTYRMESTLSRSEALALAEELRRLNPGASDSG